MIKLYHGSNVVIDKIDSYDIVVGPIADDTVGL